MNEFLFKSYSKATSIYLRAINTMTAANPNRKSDMHTFRGTFLFRSLWNFSFLLTTLRERKLQIIVTYTYLLDRDRL